MLTDRWSTITEVLRVWLAGVLADPYPNIQVRVEHEGVTDDCPAIARVVYAGSEPYLGADGIAGWRSEGCCPVWIDRWRIEVVACAMAADQFGRVLPAEEDLAFNLQEVASFLFQSFAADVDAVRDPDPLAATGSDGLPALEAVTPIDPQGGVAGYALVVRYVRLLPALETP
jgi:hypothetical protein